MSAEREPYIYAGDLNAEELLAWLEHRFNVVKAFVRKKAAIESDLVSAAFLGRDVISCLDKGGLYGVRTSQESTLPTEIYLAQKQISEFREFLNNFGIQLKGFQDEDLPAKQVNSPHN